MPYEPNLNWWENVVFTSPRYSVTATYTDRDKALNKEPPSWVDIDVNTASVGRTVRIKGELSRLFLKEFAKLRADLRGINPNGYQEWRWHDSLHPFIAMWVTRMDNIETTLKTLGVRRGHINQPEYYTGAYDPKRNLTP